MCGTDSHQPAAPSREEEENRAYRHAIHAYAEDRFMALTRKAIRALTQFRATRIFDSDSYNSVWDEYCHEVQHGPHDGLEFAFESLLDPILNDIITSLPRTEQLLLTFAANEIVGDYQEDIEMWGAVFLDNIQQVAVQQLRGIAINHDLERIRWRSRSRRRQS